MNRTADVLQFDLAAIVEGGAKSITNLLVDGARHGNTARIGDAFDARSDVDAVAHQVLSLNHDITDMDAYAQPQRLALTGLCLDLLLDFHRTGYGLNRAGELDQKAVTGFLEQAAGMLGDLVIDRWSRRRAASRARVPVSSAPIRRE